MQDRSDGLTAAILAGGGSRRYGSNKCEELLAGKTLLQWSVSYARRAADTVYLLTKEDPVNSYGTVVLRDHFSTPTPISGIMSVTPFVGDWLLLLACDIILPDPSMLDLLLDHREPGKAAVFRIGGTVQPFMAAYPRSLLGRWEEAFRRADYRLRPVVESMPKVEIDEETLAAAGITGTPLFNINTPEELHKVERIVRL